MDNLKGLHSKQAMGYMATLQLFTYCKMIKRTQNSLSKVVSNILIRWKVELFATSSEWRLHSLQNGL